MCNKAIDDVLPALKFVSDWFVTSKFSYCFVHRWWDSGDTLFSCNEMNILSIDLNNINLDDTNYDEDDAETIVHIRLLAWHSKVLQKQLMLLRHFVPNYIRKYLKQFSTWIIDVQKSLWISSSKCANVLVWIIYMRNIRTTWPIKLYMKS